jgi:hypothetical protein
MTIPDEIAAVSSGAQCHRADLYVYSHAASHDVSDPAMTPSNIPGLADKDSILRVLSVNLNTLRV